MLDKAREALSGGASVGENAMDLLLDVPLLISVELGRKRLTISEVLKLGVGSVVELEKLAGEPLDIFVNEHLVARGEAVMIGDRYGVRITAIESGPLRAEHHVAGGGIA
jgi:flagellar motor switch protein FliN